MKRQVFLRVFLRILYSLAGFCLLSGTAFAQLLKEDGFLLPVTIDGQIYRLEAYSARIAAHKGPLPLVIISHGTAGDAVENEVTHASSHRHVARDFARRGWHAVAITRRGFGVSEGQMAQTGACNAPSRYVSTFRSYSGDLLAAVDALSANKAEVDASRILFAGQSTGGLTSLVAAARKQGAKVFVANFAGGIKSERCPWEEHTAEVFAEAGKGGAQGVRSLWFYAANDSFFDPKIADKFLDHYRKAGGVARVVKFDAIADDGHYIFTDWRGREKWLPELDKFLAENNLPHLDAKAIDALGAKVKMPEKLMAHFRRYMALPGEKALAIAGSGDHVFWNYGGSLGTTASKRALEDCGKKARGCRVLLVNHDAAPAPVAAPAAPGPSAVKRP